MLEPVFLLFQALAARHPVQAQQIASSPKFSDTIAPRLKHLIAVTQQHFTDLQTVQKQLKAELETESVSSANRAVIRTKLAKVLLPYWTIRSVLHCSKLLLQTPAQFQCRLEARSWRLEEYAFACVALHQCENRPKLMIQSFVFACLLAITKVAC